MPKYVSQPRALVSVEHAKAAQALLDAGDQPGFAQWCSDHAGMVAEALRAWAALEFVMAKTSIEGLTWWSSPGLYGLKTLDSPDCTGDGDDEQWQWPTLHEVIRAAAADFAADEEGE